MKEKQFDHIENKIREAAENSVPAFDEQNWQRMEQLLDKDNKKPRPFIWYLLPVLLCAAIGGYFYFTHNPAHHVENIAGQQLAAKEKTAGTEQIISTQKNLNEIDSKIQSKSDITNNEAKNNFINNIAKLKTKSANQSNINGINKKDASVKVAANKITRNSKGKTKVTISAAVPTDQDVTSIEDNKQISELTVNEPAPDATKKDSPAEINKQSKEDSAQKNTVAQNTLSKKTKTIVSSGRSHFYFTASVGADASSVKFLSLKNSTVLAKYNFGIGYQFNKKLSVQTGFNISRKKYIAGAGDYNPKVGSYWSTVQIKKVNANCMIYEIPLAFRYNFIQKDSYLFYATTGLSSFIMKKEDYDYYYTRNNAGYYESKYSYTGNKSLFAVWTISAGIEKKISSSFSLMAEPSLSLPLAGVGDGRVKLYSMGLQLGAKYQPFKKRKQPL